MKRIVRSSPNNPYFFVPIAEEWTRALEIARRPSVTVLNEKFSGSEAIRLGKASGGARIAKGGSG